MVEALKYRLERYFDLSEVHHPASCLANFAVDADLHHKRMTVQPRAFVFGGHVGKSVRGLEGALFKKSHNRCLH